MTSIPSHFHVPHKSCACCFFHSFDMYMYNYLLMNTTTKCSVQNN